MAGPRTECGTQEEVTSSVWTCGVVYVLRTRRPEGWWLSGSGAWRSVCAADSHLDCQHLGNPGAVVVQAVCVERTCQKAQPRVEPEEAPLAWTGGGRRTYKGDGEGLTKGVGWAGPQTKEHFQNKGVVSSVRCSRVTM